MPPSSGRRGLVGGGGSSSSSRAAPAPAQSSASNTALPEYQRPSCPLSASARTALGELSGNRGIVAYEAQLKESLRFLGDSVGDLNERLLLRRERLAQLQEVRHRKGTDKLPEEERLESHVPTFERDVERLTAESEQALRQIIDQRAELEDEATVLGDIFTGLPIATSAALSASQREQGEDGAEESSSLELDRNAPPKEGLLETFRKLRAEKKAEYRAMPPYQRYALNNDYAGFKKLWHDAAVGENGPPLPDASKWFTQDGEPDMSTSSRGRKRRLSTEAGEDDANDDDREEEGRQDEAQEDEEQEEEDAEFSIQREVVSMNCPLTLLPMKEPYRNSKCPHVFEKAAIYGYLHGPGSAAELQCPQTGCSQKFSGAQFDQDFSLDTAMLRRIQREKKAKEARRDLDDVEDEDEDDEQSMVVGVQRRTGNRRERVKTEH